MLHHMKSVVHDFLVRIGNVLADRVLEAVPHVDRHADDPFQLFFRQRVPESVQAGLLAVFGHIQHAAFVQVVHQRGVFVPLFERFLVHPQMRDDLRLAPRQPALDRAVQDPMHFVPAQSELFGHRALAGFLQPSDHQSLEQHREPRQRFRPRHAHHLHPMLRTLRPRQLGRHHRLILTGVQMPPTTRLLMIVQRALPAALRAVPRRVRAMLQRHTHLPFRQGQLHVGHKPWRNDPQNLLKHLTVLHETPPDVPAYRLAQILSRDYPDSAGRNGVELC